MEHKLEYKNFIYPHYRIYERLGNLDFNSLSAIDIGSGDYRSDIAKQVLDIPFKELTSIEGYLKDYNNMLTKTFKSSKHIPIFGDVVTNLPSKKFDIAFVFDVIEHLNKEDGLILLNWIDKHITNKVLIFVPEEKQGFHRHWNDGNKLQDHISYWNEKEFIDRGYRVERIKDCHSENINGIETKYDALWAIKTL
jgi:hypothetical protein